MKRLKRSFKAEFKVLRLPIIQESETDEAIHFFASKPPSCQASETPPLANSAIQCRICSAECKIRCLGFCFTRTSNSLSLSLSLILSSLLRVSVRLRSHPPYAKSASRVFLYASSRRFSAFVLYPRFLYKTLLKRLYAPSELITFI